MARVAIVHDYLTQRGGAERVVLSLLRMFPDADLYTSVYDADGTYPEFRAHEVRTTWLQRLPHRGSWARALLPLYPLAFGSLRLEGYDLVISSSSGFAHGVRAPGARHVVYCYTPPRFLHQTATYLGRTGSPLTRRAGTALGPLLAALRRWDRRAATTPDAYVAISSVARARIAETYGRDSQIVHPPVEVDRIRPPAAPPGAEPFYLAVARLLPYKRVDLAVAACRAAGRRLVIIGDGPCSSELRALAVGADVEFRHAVSDDELNELLAGCEALFQLGSEDFGIAPLEANAAGRPAIAFAAGGALETIVDGVTGVLVETQSVEAVVAAMQKVEARRWDAALMRQHARWFGEARFHEELHRALAELGVEVPFELAAITGRPDTVIDVDGEEPLALTG